MSAKAPPKPQTFLIFSQEDFERASKWEGVIDSGRRGDVWFVTIAPEYV